MLIEMLIILVVLALALWVIELTPLQAAPRRALMLVVACATVMILAGQAGVLRL